VIADFTYERDYFEIFDLEQAKLGLNNTTRQSDLATGAWRLAWICDMGQRRTTPGGFIHPWQDCFGYLWRP